jgi:hypothetical protein
MERDSVRESKVANLLPGVAIAATENKLLNRMSPPLSQKHFMILALELQYKFDQTII